MPSLTISYIIALKLYPGAYRWMNLQGLHNSDRISVSPSGHYRANDIIIMCGLVWSRIQVGDPFSHWNRNNKFIDEALGKKHPSRGLLNKFPPDSHTTTHREEEWY